MSTSRKLSMLRVGFTLAAAAVFFAVLPRAASAASVTIVIDQRVSPKDVTIEPGTRVTFRNSDDERHRMRSRSEPEDFDSGDIEPGGSWSIVLRAPARHSYVDERNDDDPAYRGTITVRSRSSSGGSGGSGGGSTGGSAPASATVDMVDRAFSPRTIRIAVGGSVTWVNTDDRPHTATGSGFDTGTVNEGGRASERFAKTGTFGYRCILHPDMTGSVVVGSGKGGAPSVAPPKASAPKPLPKARAGSANVRIVDLDFDPRTVTVDAGGTVRWVNAGQAPHTATGDGATFDSGMLEPGTGYSKRFMSAGTFPYFCAVHPEMRGTVRVRNASGSVPKAAKPSPSATPSVEQTATPAAQAPVATGRRGPPRAPLLNGATVTATLFGIPLALALAIAVTMRLARRARPI